MPLVFDAAWRQRALLGDADAVRQLAETTLQPLYVFCLYRVGRDSHRCEEVVQETLVRALRDLEHYEPARCNDNILPWLIGLARNEIARVLARNFNARVQGFCKGLWEHRQNLWTFVEVEGVEPTNNAAEQALRQAVIWRKLSFGTQTASGSRFVERLLTVVETCRRQQRNVLSWMVETVEARFAGKTAPSLLSGE